MRALRRFLLDRLVDPQLGLVQSVETTGTGPEVPGFFRCLARPGRLQALGWVGTDGVAATCATHPEAAEIGAILDALARYCAGFYVPAELVEGRAADAGGRCLDPGIFCIADRDGTDGPRPDAQTTLRWAKVRQLGKERLAWAPAAAVHQGYPIEPGVPESGFRPPFVSGLSCALTPAQARAQALLRLHAQDALFSAWSADRELPGIRVETLSDTHFDQAEDLAHRLGGLSLLDASELHGVPSVLAVSGNAGADDPTRVAAGACGLSPEVAVGRAIEALVLAVMERRDCLRAGRVPLGERQAGNWWIGGAIRKPMAAAQPFSAGTPVDYGDFCGRFPVKIAPEALVRKAVEDGLTLLEANITRPDVHQCGVVAIQLVTPQLHGFF